MPGLDAFVPLRGRGLVLAGDAGPRAIGADGAPAVPQRDGVDVVAAPATGQAVARATRRAA